ncbi:hypothetical protein C8R42DRAFT_591696, partial [Lentinula raphanica]
MVVEVENSWLFADEAQLRGKLRTPLITATLGKEPTNQILSLSLFHAYSYFNFDTPTHEGILALSAITAEEVQRNLSRSDSLLDSTPEDNSYVTYQNVQVRNNQNKKSISPNYPALAATKKKYKPVHRRITPVPATLPEKFRVIRQFPTDPLKNLPKLDPHPPAFIPTGRYTQDRKEFIDSVHDQSFLWPQE